MANRIQAVCAYLTSQDHFPALTDVRGIGLAFLWDWTQVPTQSTFK